MVVKMIAKKQLKQLVKRQVKSSHPFLIRFLTFKKDRLLELSYREGKYFFVEDGFEKKEQVFTTAAQASKALLQAAEYEFKRSHKLYFIQGKERSN